MSVIQSHELYGEILAACHTGEAHRSIARRFGLSEASVRRFRDILPALEPESAEPVAPEPVAPEPEPEPAPVAPPADTARFLELARRGRADELANLCGGAGKAADALLAALAHGSPPAPGVFDAARARVDAANAAESAIGRQIDALERERATIEGDLQRAVADADPEAIVSLKARRRGVNDRLAALAVKRADAALDVIAARREAGEVERMNRQYAYDRGMVFANEAHTLATLRHMAYTDRHKTRLQDLIYERHSLDAQEMALIQNRKALREALAEVARRDD